MKSIEEMAQEAGFYPPDAKMLPQGEEMLRRFAALVAEQCSILCARQAQFGHPLADQQPGSKYMRMGRQQTADEGAVAMKCAKLILAEFPKP